MAMSGGQPSAADNTRRLSDADYPASPPVSPCSGLYTIPFLYKAAAQRRDSGDVDAECGGDVARAMEPGPSSAIARR
jgi:hypothetical protein